MQRKGQPTMILTCQHDSHYFEERTIIVNEIVKVGRAVARSKASSNNAIFDCKVLSRNHALIWFSSDEFWLRDTNSSNGTYVNNTRVSKRDNSDYCDRQIFSGDVIRFGVDVVEHDTTHGCIIASVTLILPNGQEAKPKLGHTGDAITNGLISINNEQMFQISCFLNDAIFREQALDEKLEALGQALQQATLASELGWQAMLNEERLLQKFDLYENQMRLFKEELSEGSLKLRLSEVLEEKSLIESESKAQLTKLVRDKENALQRIRDLERTIEDLQEECKHLRNECASVQDACNNISDEYKANLSTVSQRLNDLTTEHNQMSDQLQQASQENSDLKQQLERVSHELTVARELCKQGQVKGSSGLINGLSYTNDPDEESNASTNSDAKLMAESCKNVDNILLQNQSSDLVSCDGLLVKPSELEANEYISDSIRDFHRALELIRVLDAKISALALTTDLDEAKKSEAASEDVSGSTNTDPTDGVSSLSSSSIESLVKRIVRYNEAAMTSLHAYLRQVNPSAATELINKIHLTGSSLDEGSDYLSANAQGKVFKRPDILKLNNLVDKAVEAVASSVWAEGVTIVGADSLSASPTVSSGNGSLSFSTPSDAEEIIHLRECIRLANEEIEQYKAHIDELRNAGRDKATALPSNAVEGPKGITSQQDLEEMHAECCVLRARLGDIEEQMAHTRENHRRLVEEVHQHRNEVENLRSQRSELKTALAASQAQIAKLHQQMSDCHNPRPSTSNNHLLPTTCLPDTPVHADRLELVPGRLVTVSSLTVFPLMLLVFAVMFAIFSKFVS